jgi:hypothetical protein
VELLYGKVTFLNGFSPMDWNSKNALQDPLLSPTQSKHSMGHCNTWSSIIKEVVHALSDGTC